MLISYKDFPGSCWKEASFKAFALNYSYLPKSLFTVSIEENSYLSMNKEYILLEVKLI